MVEDAPSPDFPEFKDETVLVWNSIAEWWDDAIGDGNDFQTVLIEPATERMLELQPGETVLDVACGAGRFARRMADLSADVVAIDQSERFINRARRRTGEGQSRVEYRVMDASDPEALLTLGLDRFDAAVCTMALMDMAMIEPLLSTLPRLLKPGGRFVFSVAHPVFNSGTAHQTAERYDRDGALVTEFGVRVTRYLEPYVHMGVGVPSQPQPQHYFHRPVSLLFNTCFKYGFVLDRMEEPAFPAGLDLSGEGPLSWNRFHLIPPVLAARMCIQ